MKPTILIVDDEKNTREGLKKVLKPEGYSVFLAKDGVEAIEIIKEEKVDIALIDLKMPKMDGLEVMRKVQSLSPSTMMVMLTAYGTVETAVEAMKEGAFDYMTKPVNLDKLVLIVKKAITTKDIQEENVKLKQQLQEKYGFENIIGKTDKMQKVYDTITQIAPSKATVLIEGESGTGKELIAHAIHYNSDRKDKPFVAVHCASLSGGILESELFGHEKGSFTGAIERKLGRFEVADGGTIFLDEVSEIPQGTQVKLLRVLQEREFERVGGTKKVKVDVRLITATNQNLEERIKEGRFREDLYYRIKVVSIAVPPLRARKEDIPLLIGSFLKEFNEQNRKNVEEITSQAMDLLMEYNWPGNIRELRNVIESMIVLSKSDKIGVSDLPGNIKDKIYGIRIPPEDGLKIKGAEERLIVKALEESNNNRTKAAELLGLSRRTLYRKLREYGIE